jgi:hypothetical protein
MNASVRPVPVDANPKRSPTVLRALGCGLLLVAGCDSCDSSSSTEPGEEEDQPPDAASSQVSSNQSGTISTPGGAKITVPMYAVPLSTSGGNGTMTFSIEEDTSSSFPTPSGETLKSDLYRFGPEGFTLAAPVKITIPVPSAGSGDVVGLYRINPTTGAAIRYPSQYDAQAHTVSAMTTQLSVWGATTRPSSSTADGAVHLINTSGNYWLSACVDTYTLTYPGGSPEFGMATAAPAGTIGWNSDIVWGLRQGTYRICCQMATQGTTISPPGPPAFWYVNNVVVNKASVYPSYESSGNYTYGGPPIGSTAGNCPCKPYPTPSVGTGQVQVTLTWYSSAQVDLDLHVTDPAGQTVYYNNKTVASGGSLDRDNQCDDYVNGRPENVFWSAAPTGDYTVVVKWYEACTSGASSMPFTVRVVNKGTVSTHSGTVSAGSPSVEVVKFKVR